MRVDCLVPLVEDVLFPGSVQVEAEALAADCHLGSIFILSRSIKVACRDLIFDIK